jgi:phosphoesterase RecJ-like protein
MTNLIAAPDLIADLFATPRRILLTTHKSPDGDAIGSMLALYHVLVECGHDVTPACPDLYPGFLNWMPGIEQVLMFDTPEGRAAVEHAVQSAEIHISLDYNALHRLGAEMAALCDTFEGKRILIDHHREPDTQFHYSYHSIDASSTAELVFGIINQITPGVLPTIDVARCLYAGIVTDTGSFRFPSTTAHTLSVVAQLMEAGLKPSEVYNQIFDTNSLDRLRLLGYVLAEKLIVIPELQTAYIALSQQDLNRFNYRQGDSEGFVNYALSVEGIRFACLLKENGEDVRISLRSKGMLDVNTLSRKHFNGGGHLNAAGGRLSLPLSDAINTFLGVLDAEKDMLQMP